LLDQFVFIHDAYHCKTHANKTILLNSNAISEIEELAINKDFDAENRLEADVPKTLFSRKFSRSGLPVGIIKKGR